MGNASFPATRWTLVLAAGQGDQSASNQAVAELCSAYWYPVYAFVRRLGHSPEEAQDLTQDFFVTFLDKRYFSVADREKGRFRSFLLTAVKHFVSDQIDRRNAEKRGGKAQNVPIDPELAEREYVRELIANDTPETIFEREWARTLMDRVLREIRFTFECEGRATYFDSLRPFLPGHGSPATYDEVARKVGLTEGALKVAVHRLRRKYRELFYSEISDLVSDPSQVEAEVQHLLKALRT